MFCKSAGEHPCAVVPSIAQFVHSRARTLRANDAEDGIYVTTVARVTDSGDVELLEGFFRVCITFPNSLFPFEPPISIFIRFTSNTRKDFADHCVPEIVSVTDPPRHASRPTLISPLLAPPSTILPARLPYHRTFTCCNTGTSTSSHAVPSPLGRTDGDCEGRMRVARTRAPNS